MSKEWEIGFSWGWHRSCGVEACVRLFLENIEEYLAAAPAWHFHEQSIIQNVWVDGMCSSLFGRALKLMACVHLYLDDYWSWWHVFISFWRALKPLSALVWSSARIEKWNEHEEGIVIRCNNKPPPCCLLACPTPIAHSYAAPTVLLVNAMLH